MSKRGMERDVWRAAERLLRIYGELAEEECRDRISYCHMTWKWSEARAWRLRLEAVRRLRHGEKPPLFLEDAVAAGRFSDFLAQQESQGMEAASFEQDVTAVIRDLVRARLREARMTSPA